MLKSSNLEELLSMNMIFLINVKLQMNLMLSLHTSGVNLQNL